MTVSILLGDINHISVATSIITIDIGKVDYMIVK